MRKNIQAAWKAFCLGQHFTTSNGSLNVFTDRICSYDMPIVWRNADGTIEFMAGKAPSKTTATHLNGMKELFYKGSL